MKVLIIGATGMIGHRLWLGLSDTFDVYGTTRRPIDSLPILGRVDRSHCISLQDVQDYQSVEEVVMQCRPDVVINCIGVVKQLDLSKNSIASIALNALFPHQLSEICKKYESRMIQFSTDCVFKGDKGNYKESDSPDAVDIYGRTKAMGEVDYVDHVLTLRTSFIGREIFPHGSLVTWFESQNGKKVSGFSNAIYSGVPTHALVKILKDEIIPRRELSGLYNLSSDPISKFDLLNKIKNAFQLNIEIEKNEEFKVDRSLDSTLLKERLNLTIPNWDTLMEDLVIDSDFYKGLQARN